MIKIENKSELINRIKKQITFLGDFQCDGKNFTQEELEEFSQHFVIENLEAGYYKFTSKEIKTNLLQWKECILDGIPTFRTEDGLPEFKGGMLFSVEYRRSSELRGPWKLVFCSFGQWPDPKGSDRPSRFYFDRDIAIKESQSIFNAYCKRMRQMNSM